jgi:hypothetical protein
MLRLRGDRTSLLAALSGQRTVGSGERKYAATAARTVSEQHSEQQMLEPQT